MNVPASLVPQYSVNTGPHHSIIARLVAGEIGAAPCSTWVSDDGSNVARTSSGSRSRRTIIVGTRCMCAMCVLLDAARAASPASKRGIDHDRRPVDEVEQRVAADRGVVVRSGQQMWTGAVEPDAAAERSEQLEVLARGRRDARA